MTYTTTDIARIIKLYALHRSQYESNSQIRQLANDQELFDQQHAAQTVDEVREALEDLFKSDGLLAQLESSRTPVQSVSRPGEYSITYGGAGARRDSVTQQIKGIKQRISQLLDPGGTILEDAMRGKVYRV